MAAASKPHITWTLGEYTRDQSDFRDQHTNISGFNRKKWNNINELRTCTSGEGRYMIQHTIGADTWIQRDNWYLILKWAWTHCTSIKEAECGQNGLVNNYHTVYCVYSLNLSHRFIQLWCFNTHLIYLSLIRFGIIYQNKLAVITFLCQSSPRQQLHLSCLGADCRVEMLKGSYLCTRILCRRSQTTYIVLIDIAIMGK